MDAQYFIDKFEAIPEEKWTTHTQIDHDGKRCALGHFLPAEYRNINDWYSGSIICGSHTEEGKAMARLFGGEFCIAKINNGGDPKYQQATPKQRILAALRDVQIIEQQDKAVEEANALVVIPICPGCGKPTNKCECGESDNEEDVDSEEDWGAGETLKNKVLD